MPHTECVAKKSQESIFAIIFSYQQWFMYVATMLLLAQHKSQDCMTFPATQRGETLVAWWVFSLVFRHFHP